MMKFSKNRLETFCDGVIAVIITIMVLEIPLPNTFEFASIIDLLRSILIFFASFIIVGNYWTNHHVWMEQISEVSNKFIWRNLLFLFFLALMPIFTKWVILYSNEVVPVIGYDIVFLLVNASSYWIGSEAAKQEGGVNIQKRRQRFGGQSRWLPRWIIMAIIIGAIIILSLFYPDISIIFFIGLPVFFSLFNLIIERNEKL